MRVHLLLLRPWDHFDYVPQGNSMYINNNNTIIIITDIFYNGIFYHIFVWLRNFESDFFHFRTASIGTSLTTSILIENDHYKGFKTYYKILFINIVRVDWMLGQNIQIKVSNRLITT